MHLVRVLSTNTVTKNVMIDSWWQIKSRNKCKY
jgi:hypothetical protein